jgi:hypothetical protein
LTQSDLGYSTEILDKLYSLLITYTQKHCKALFIRFDLHFEESKQACRSNRALDHFLENFKKRLIRDDLDPRVFWVREQTSLERNQHYHLILLVDGNKTQSYFNHLETAKEIWSWVNMVNESSSTVNFCNKNKNGNNQQNGVMMRRSPDGIIENFQQCFQWASYLAKFETKGMAPRGVRETGCSNVTNYNQISVENMGIQLQ